jgi:hypothetical protein
LSYNLSGSKNDSNYQEFKKSLLNNEAKLENTVETLVLFGIFSHATLDFP